MRRFWDRLGRVVLERFREFGTGVSIDVLLPEDIWTEQLIQAATDPIGMAMDIGAKLEWNEYEKWRKRRGKAGVADIRLGLPPVVQAGIGSALADTMRQPYWPGMIQRTRDQVGRTIGAGLTEGLSNPQIAAQLQQVLGPKANRARALRIAQTECLPGDAFVNSANATAAYRRWYCGPMVHVITDHGCKFTGTPNHPVLTLRGWVALGDLEESDYLIGDGRNVEGLGPSGNQDVDAPPATIGEIFDSLAAVVVPSRERTGKPDFHGDGANSYVDTLRPGRLLTIGDFAPVDDRSAQHILVSSRAREVADAANGNMFARGLSVNQCHTLGERSHFPACPLDRAADACFIDPEFFAQDVGSSALLVTSPDLMNVEFWGPASVTSRQQILARLRLRPDFDAGLTACIHNRVLATTELRGKSPRTRPGHIKLHRLTSLVRIERWSGHVYNLTTVEGYFVANGLYTGNTTGALNGGHQATRDMLADEGIVKRKEWLAILDMVLRPTHFQANHQKTDAKGMFTVGGRQTPYPGHTSLPAKERVHCFVPGVEVQGSFVAGMRSEYTGRVTEIVTRSGRRLTVTPNHPILTEHGFIAAGLLEPGDKILAYNAKIDASAVMAPGGNEIEHEPAVIEDVFQAIALLGGIKVERAEKDDFHGDGARCNGKIDIVSVDGRLLSNLEPSRPQEGGDIILALEDREAFSLPGLGDLDSGGERPLATSRGCPSRFALAFDGGPVVLQSRQLQPLRIGSAAYLNASLFESPVDHKPGHSELLGDRIDGIATHVVANNGSDIEVVPIARPINAFLLQDPVDSRPAAMVLARNLRGRHPGSIEVDDVVAVNVFEFCGHVYDLESTVGFLVANGILTSNCRCVAISSFDDEL